MGNHLHCSTVLNWQKHQLPFNSYVWCAQHFTLNSTIPALSTLSYFDQDHQTIIGLQIMTDRRRKKLQPCLADCRFREMFLFSEIWISESFFQCLGSRNLVSEKKRALSVSGICYWWTDIFYFSTFQTILKLSGADSPVSDNSNILSDLQTHTQCTAVRDRTRCAHCYICHRDFNAGVGRNQRFKGVGWCIYGYIHPWLW